jgi:hypothetical protein
MLTAKLLSRAEASRYLLDAWDLRYTVASLKTLACRKTGPRITKTDGFHVGNAIQDIDDWVEQMAPCKRAGTLVFVPKRRAS